MSRSKWKIPFVDKNFLKLLGRKNKNLQTWSKRSTIYPAAIGKTFFIYNGKDMIRREIKDTMVGHKIGEFIQTRRPFRPPKKKK